jgi:hypothetical protein
MSSRDGRNLILFVFKSARLKERKIGMVLIVGVDIGGTFANFGVVDTESGTITTSKVLATPTEPGRGQ